MGKLASLEDWLQEAHLQGVVSFAEAWAIQDQRNLSMGPRGQEPAVLMLPPELWPAAKRIWLHQVLEGETLQ